MHGNGFAQTHIPFQQNILAQLTITSYDSLGDASAKPNKYEQYFNYEVDYNFNVTSSILGMSSLDSEKKLNIKTAMLLAPNENSALLDKRELRNLGIQHINIYTSGLEAANALSKLNAKDTALLPQVILCQEILADMTSAEFVILIRNHPQLLGIPVLALTSQSSVADEVNALASGFSALLARPYSSIILKETIIEASFQALFVEKLKQIHTPTTADKFYNALKKINYVKSIEHIPMEYFKEGLNLLRQKQWDQSIGIFQKSIRQAGIKGNSELGLAAAYKGKLNAKKYKHYLNMACLTFAKNKQWNKARTVYSQLLKDDAAASSPFIQLAEYFIKESRFDDAASSLVAGYGLGSNNNIAQSLVSACSNLKYPEDAIKTLVEHLRNLDMPDLALQLQEQTILDELNKLKKEEVEKKNVLRQLDVAKEMRTQTILANIQSNNKELADLIIDRKGALQSSNRKSSDNFSDQLSLDKISSDKISSDKLSGDKLSGDKLSGDKLSGDKLSGDKLSGDKPSNDHLSLDKLPLDDDNANHKKIAMQTSANADATNEKPTSMSGLSEILTVAKMTWKLFKK